jgi:hypothetical protein
MLCHGLKPRELRHAAPGIHGFRLGGDSSSSSSSSTTNQNQDRRIVVEGGVGVSSDESTVNVSALDGGAIDRAIDLATSTIGSSEARLGDILDASSAQLSDVVEFARASDAQRAQTLDSILGLGRTVLEQGFGLLDRAQTGIQDQGALLSTAYDNAQGAGDEKQLVAYAVIGAVAFVAVKSWGK